MYFLVDGWFVVLRRSKLWLNLTSIEEDYRILYSIVVQNFKWLDPLNATLKLNLSQVEFLNGFRGVTLLKLSRRHSTFLPFAFTMAVWLQSNLLLFYTFFHHSVWSLVFIIWWKSFDFYFCSFHRESSSYYSLIITTFSLLSNWDVFTRKNVKETLEIF